MPPTISDATWNDRMVRSKVSLLVVLARTLHPNK
jgi:hypothetical protein